MDNEQETSGSDEELQESQTTEREKTLTQSEVNRIVQREKAAVAERIRREMEQANQQSQTGTLDVDAIKEQLLSELRAEQEKQAQAEQQRLLQEQEDEINRHLESVGQKYQMRLSEGPKKYSDFDDVMTNFDIKALPRTAFLATELEETSDIMYELASDPKKAVLIEQLAERSPDMALRELTKLRDSIVANQQAIENEPNVSEPLNRPKSSQVAGSDTGNLSIADYRKMDWLRG